MRLPTRLRALEQQAEALVTQAQALRDAVAALVSEADVSEAAEKAAPATWIRMPRKP